MTAPAPGSPEPRTPEPATAVLRAPAKLTLRLRVTGVRPDGYHLLDAEMVTVDLADTLTMRPGQGLRTTVVGPGRSGASGRGTVPEGPANLVTRALAAVEREAAVDLLKRIPPGAGLGGGSADAAAVLRWAGCTDPAVAAGLGADVPFCLAGGRARVRGIGERVAPLSHVEGRFTLVLLPFAVDTTAAYRAWDELAATGDLPPAPDDGPPNDLEAPVLAIEPRMARWRELLAALTGRRPRLAGSGSTWFFDGDPADLGLDSSRPLRLDGAEGWLVGVRTVPRGWPAAPVSGA
jgi:4-diphosphocytidyl-2-C-methyl-D-erythritol kinase